MAIDCVVFDIGNVLIEWNPERVYDRLIGADRRRAMFAALDLHAMNDAVDAGAPWRETVAAFADANPAWRAEILMWHDHWLEMASPAIPQSVALLRALRARGVRVASLTNFGVETFAFACQHYDFLTEFDEPFVSGHLRVTKPAAEIYRLVEAAGHAPEGLLFTDDRAENIEAARARGWQVHLFTGWQGWAARLVEEGLLTEQEAGL